MVIQATLKLRNTALENEAKLLAFVRDLHATRVHLKDVLNREKLAGIINVEHDYVENCHDDESSDIEVVTPQSNVIDLTTDDVEEICEDNQLEFDVVDSIETFKEFSDDILKLFWGEKPVLVKENKRKETENTKVRF